MLRAWVVASLLVGLSCQSFAGGGQWTVVAWNNLGMHCMDDDYSIFTILPPFNTVNAQLINAQGKLVTASTGLTLTYEAVAMLTEVGLGQSTAVGIGGDPINGLKHIDVMQAFNDDPDTDAVIMIGEIGGPDEAEAARWCKANMKKPIVGFIAGVTAPAGKRMGHAGALISGGADTADAKLAIMEECGFIVTRNPSELGKLLKAQL